MFGIPIEFILFALTLLGVALFHNQTFYVALTGVAAVAIYKIAVTGFKTGTGVAGFAGHLGHEWVTLVNLFCLLMGFAILARHFEKSHVPVILPKYLPDDWKGPFVLLVMVWTISSFLDNIAAALIGGAMAHQLFKAKVHIGYLAGIVAASNAGGAFSVVGDTTTTLMWIAGVAPGRCSRRSSRRRLHSASRAISRPSSSTPIHLSSRIPTRIPVSIGGASSSWA
jgi:Na+/H+ antiporter NhaD/arsenite permease-like protein